MSVIRVLEEQLLQKPWRIKASEKSPDLTMRDMVTFERGLPAERSLYAKLNSHHPKILTSKPVVP